MAAIVCAPLIGIAQLQITLTPSNYNGSNISCFGKKDGAIDLSVTGGTPPYTFGWSTGATTEDVVNLPSGYYKVEVIDADSTVVHGEITLLDPNPIKLTAEANEYANGYHISCYSCYNGSINVTTTGGTAPYSYVWRDGTTTEDRSGLGARDYTVTMTDANGCTTEPRSLTLREPERSDWMMSGNANTIPGTHFFGTTDAKDVVFKSNGVERLRVTSGGSISLLGNAAIGKGFLYIDSLGILKAGPYPYADMLPEGPCYALSSFPFWETRGNSFLDPLCDAPSLGTMSNHPLRIVTNGELRMLVSTTGLVGIGGFPQNDQLEVHTAMANSGLSLVNTLAGGNARTVVRFKKGTTSRWELGCDLNQNGTNNFFLWDAVAQSPRMVVDENGKVAIGTLPPSGVVEGYRLFVEDGIATRDVLVKLGDWPDYVFEEGYHLLSLVELKDYLNANGHLPGIPSAADVDEKGGVELGDLQRRMLETVEQQALYILQLEDRMRAMEVQVATLKAGK